MRPSGLSRIFLILIAVFVAWPSWLASQEVPVAEIAFLDAFGEPAAEVVLGQPARLRVVNVGANQDPLQVEPVLVRLHGLTSGDTEEIDLDETGVDTGVFEGEMPTGRSLAEPFNAFFEIQPRETVRAEHVFGPLGDSVEATAVVEPAGVALVDEDGVPVSAILESSTVFLRVFDSQKGFPFEVDRVSVEVFSALTGDREVVELVETGSATFTFEGSIGLELVTPDAFPSSGDGTLATTEEPGSPASFDTVRAVYSTPFGQVEGTARTLGSRTAFVDGRGNEVETVTVGERVFVRVEDQNANDPSRLDQVGAILVSQGGPELDVEDLVLTETGRDTGLFLGSVGSSAAFPSTQNGNLEMFPGTTIFAEHIDALRLSSSRDEAAVTSASVTFVDGEGEPTDRVLYGGVARVRVFSNLENFDPTVREEIGAEVTTTLTGDVESVLLRETGSNTSLFEGSLPVAFSFEGSTPGDGVIEAGNTGSPGFEGDVLTATFFGADEVSALAEARGSFTFIVDESGRRTETVTLGRPLRVRVVDPSANASPGQAEETFARVDGLSRGDREVFFLIETGLDTGVFEGEIPTGLGAAGTFNGFFEIEPGETVRAFHSGPEVPGESEDTAVVSSGAIQIIDSAGEPAEEIFESSRAFFQVFDRFVGSPFQVDTVTIEVFSTLTSDREVVQLQETGTETFTFEGSISTELLAPIFSATADGVLQVTENPGPPFSFDTIRAVYATPFGQATDSVPTVGSRVELVDHLGQPVEVYGVGDTVFVQVEDQNVNDRFRRDQTTVFLGIPGPSPEEFLDAEELVLDEVDPAAGVFVGSIDSRTGTPGFFNGTLEVAGDQLLQAAHRDALRLSFSLDTATFGAPPTPPATIELLDEAGEPADVVFHEAVVNLRMTSVSDNEDPAREDEVIVAVTTANSGDREDVVLTETGDDTGVFEGSAFLRPELSPTPGNGLVEVDTSGGLEIVTAEVEPGIADSVAAVPFQAFFADVQNLPIDSIPIDATHRLVVKDSTRAGEANVQARLQGSLGGDSETVTLRATSNPEMFLGFLLLRNRGATPNNRVLEGQLGEVFTLTYGNPTVGVSLTEDAVARRNVAPTPQDDFAVTDEDTPVEISILANDTDPDGESVDLASGVSSEDGTVFIDRDADGRRILRFVPNRDFFGVTTFPYFVRDLAGAGGSATVTVTVNPVNDPPIARDDVRTTAEDVPVNVFVLDNDTDVEDPFLETITSFTQPANGTVSLSASGAFFQYAPALNFHGTDTFTYTVQDSEGAEDTAMVTVTVTPVNDPPILFDDEARTRENVAVSVPVLDNDFDVENDPLTVTAASAVVGGTVVLEAEGSVTFTPADNFDGVASFTYTVSDGMDTATASVTIRVVDALERTVVLTTGTVRLGVGTEVASGDVIAHETAADPNLFELDLVENITTAAGWDLKADSLRVGPGSMVESDVDFNELMEEGSIFGERTPTLSLPVFAELPPFFEAVPGTANVEVKANRAETLGPGAHGIVSVARKSTLVLTGGRYDLESLRLEPEARVVFAGPAEVRVAGQVRLDETAGIEPEADSGLTAADLVLYVAGMDGAGEGEPNGPTAVQIGADSSVRANLYAPHGTVSLGNRVIFEGAAVARYAETGQAAKLTLDSAFVGPLNP